MTPRRALSRPHRQVSGRRHLTARPPSPNSDCAPPSPPGRLSSEKTWLPGLRTPSTSTSPLALWLGALVLVIAATDLAAVAYTARLARTVFAPKDFAARLEYASPYIGLDELYASGQVNASVLEPITIRPRIAAQVFVQEPDRPAPRGEHDYWHETYGRMSPNERRLRVSPDVSLLCILDTREQRKLT